jgi:hypothetical protein
MLLLVVRLAPDVRGKPVFEDEAVAGLVAAQPLREMLATVVVDRGGAPLHFLLAHAAFGFDPSSDALRWVSVVLALLVVPICFDLGRRLAGPVAGAAAAALAASSQMLGIYGSVGRMYALLALAAALSADLFVRATQRRTRRAAVIAAAGAWFLPASHPFGVVLVAAEAIVAAILWRGRSIREALPVAAVGLAMVPFAYADLRLADRFGAGLSGHGELVTPQRAATVLVRALGGFAGGREPVFILFAGLATAGAVALWRRERAFLALTAVALVGLPALLVGTRGGQDFSEHFSSRQLIFALPLWLGLVGAGFAHVVRHLAPHIQALCVTALTAVALVAPQAVPDPRTARSGSRGALAAPAAWLRGAIPADGVLFPASPVFLAALPAARHARALPREQPSLVTRALDRDSLPAPAVIVAVPLDGVRVDGRRLAAALGRGYRNLIYPSWLLVEAVGPFHNERSVLAAIAHAIEATDESMATRSVRLTGYLRQSRASVCGSLRSFGGRCQ